MIYAVIDTNVLVAAAKTQSSYALRNAYSSKRSRGYLEIPGQARDEEGKAEIPDQVRDEEVKSGMRESSPG